MDVKLKLEICRNVKFIRDEGLIATGGQSYGKNLKLFLSPV